MFGYIMVDEKQLAPAEMDRYREVYCGVCHSLKDQSGQLCRMALTYDMTFLALLLNSLYEPNEKKSAERCAAADKRDRRHLDPVADSQTLRFDRHVLGRFHDANHPVPEAEPTVSPASYPTERRPT